jgi:predicted  nucleic acid-binding Zn-ribbon protein
MTSNNIMLIAIGLGVCIIIILGIVIYNVIRMNNMKTTNKEKHDSQLVNISRNQKNLNVLNSTIIEEKKALSEKIKINKNNINANKSNVLYNASIINKNIENISSNSKNITDVGDSFNTQLNDLKSKNMEDLNDIRQKNSRIQSNIGDFKYDDYLVSLGRLSEVEIKHNTLNSSVSTLNTDLKEVQRTYATRSNMHSYLDRFYNSDILPKFEIVNSNINDLHTYKEVLETRIGSNEYKFRDYYSMEGINNVLNSYVLKANLPESTDLTPYATKDLLTSNLEVSLRDYTTTSELPSALKAHYDDGALTHLSPYALVSDYTKTDDMVNFDYATNSTLSQYALASDYTTTSDLPTALENHYDDGNLTNLLSPYATNSALFVTNTNLNTTNDGLRETNDGLRDTNENLGATNLQLNSINQNLTTHGHRSNIQ